MNTAEDAILKTLSGLDRTLEFSMRGICIVCLFFLLLLLAGNVFFRFVTILSMGWFDEIVELLFAWLVFIGAAALWRENSHFRVEWIYAKFENRKAGDIIGLLVDLLGLFFMIVMTWQGLRITLLATDWTPILKFPKRLMYVDIPIAGSLMIIYSIRNIINHSVSLINSCKQIAKQST
jgi:TRAP-type C4-dicarboxylate transport system permease small subunit